MLIVFPVLTFAAIQVLFVRCLLQNGLVPKLHATCDAAVIDSVSLPTRIAYTNIPALDFNLCAIVAFYHGSMNQTYRPLLIHMCTTLSAIAIIPFVEAARKPRSTWLRMPAATGIFFQLCSCAVIMPVYCFAFMLTGGTNRRSASDNINQRDAEALLSTLLVGYALPTVCMVVLENPVMTAIWQVFPLYMKAAQWAHCKIRPPSLYAGSGYRIVQVVYMLVFLASASLHVAYIWPLFSSPTLFRNIMIPPTTSLDPATISITEGAAAFLKWDMIFGAGSTVLMTLWFARNLTDLVLLVLWHALATIAVGPGAAIAGAMLWREATIKAQASANTDKTQ